VPISDRAALANTNKADVFISLHANASYRDTLSGATVYTAAFDADAVNASPTAPERLPAIGGGLRDIELVPWDVAQIRHKDQSDAFARMIVESFQNRVPLSGRAWDQAALRVLESANMAAVLVEMGYLTNPAQEKQLRSDQLQTAIAQGIVDALVRFRDAVGPSEGATR
jgi:N-acetylmuramoyl-L-alanine amidase